MQGNGVKYGWKARTRRGLSAQVAGDHLEGLRMANDGRLTPELVVEDARHKKSPLHDYFEWDDRKAAKAYRVEQARYMIRSVVIIRDEQPEVRAFVHVTQEDDDRPTFCHLVAARNDESLWEQVLDQALEELRIFREKYQQLKELAPVHRAIQRVLDEVEKPPRAARRAKARPKRPARTKVRKATKKTRT